MIATATKEKTVAAFNPIPAGSPEILTGEQVLNLIKDPAFIESWNELFNACPWATVFQSSSFVATWYQFYEKEFLPILVKTEYAGKLTGLLTLTKGKNGLITGAGTNQAEYQVWLTTDDPDETFIKGALTAITRKFPNNRILLKYIPAGTSLHFTKEDPVWKKRSILMPARQPVMVINDDHFTSELKKKNRREKVNRLKRQGELKLERITDYATFVSVFDELALQNDFRKGAMYNKMAFKTDRFRKPFFLALFQQNVLHATLLKIGDKIISSNVAMGGPRELHLQGINSFDAAYAKHSPGIIHFLMLGKLLAQEGTEVFDLTPGADGYKDVLATDHKVAYTLNIGSNFDGFKTRMNFRINGYFKKAIGIVGADPEKLKKRKKNLTQRREKFMNIARRGFSSWVAYTANLLKERNKTMKCWVVQKGAAISGELNVQKDDLKNLMNYDPGDVRYSHQEFLSDAMRRFEEGGHCYTWADKGRLSGCAWVASQQSSVADNKFGGITDGSVFMLSNVYCHPKSRNQFPVFLQSVAKELAIDNPHDKFYIVTDSNDELLFEKAGFKRLK
ncbi:GNAT family N-acetyltransferase [Longitalea luteola]|uniref:GNAT family N-acetyltransferase n=1 Tax=Longitalea luteola TaxID=2812563 RepID=UPI001A95F1F7|nr:GNAT family N-acetyltransferase [Longitalea luteola]